MNPKAIEATARALAEARSVLAITGAGISADSGLPTYRGIGGLYNDASTDEGVPIEVALSGHTMNTNPGLCWKYIAQVEQASRGAMPNAGHEVIAKLESRIERVVVLTQNVDGLHRSAGSTNIIDIHGDVHDLYCTRCAHSEVRTDYVELAIPPLCPSCGGLIRPDVVLFGEMLPGAKVSRLRAELGRGFDVVLSIGTTSVFPYIASPFAAAAAQGRAAIEINPAATDVSHLATTKLEAGAADALSSVWQALSS